MNVGVLLTRAQPFHLGHVSVLKQALAENEKVILVIGSANKSKTKRNPIPIDIRLSIVEDFMERENIPMERVKIVALSDWSSEDAYEYAKEWGRFFYYNVVNEAESKNFTLYYNDDLKIVENWFDKDLRERIIIKNSVRNGISSTKTRNAILDDNLSYVETAMGTTAWAKILKQYLIEASN